MAQIERDNLLKKKVSCSVCGKDISKDQTVLHLQSTNCFHSSHDTCLRQDMLKQLKQTEVAKCQLCKAEIACWEYNQYFTKEERQELDDWAIKKLKSLDIGIHECLCGHLFSADQGPVPKSYKDDLGNPISDAAAVHMSINRIHCPKCERTFCSSCKTAPYHLGKNCQENEAYKKQDKCRFCYY